METNFNKSTWVLGQKVYCLMYGEGIIINFNEGDHPYPIQVSFTDGIIQTYTFEGKFRTYENFIFLYPYKVEIIRENELKEGDEVLASDFEDKGYSPAIFICGTKNAYYVVLKDGDEEDYKRNNCFRVIKVKYIKKFFAATIITEEEVAKAKQVLIDAGLLVDGKILK